MKKFLFIIFITILFTFSTFSHGVICDFIQKNVGLKITYEDGTPFVNANVDLYSPDDYKNPILKSTTDEKGQFFFEPDKAGTWIVMIRDNMGHGTRKNITIGDDLQPISENNKNSLNFVQKIIIAISVIWGLIGTALFYNRKKG